LSVASDAIQSGMRYLFLAVATAIAAGCVPADIARSSCESIMMSTANPYSCTVKADVVGRASSIEFDSESRNQIARVSIVLSVAKGTLRVGYSDLAGQHQVVVTPSEPASLDIQTRMHRDRRSFTLTFEPLNGVVQGLSGTVKYSTP
jgi:hypothetical protein